jgi:hypothetical protein
MKRIRRPIPRPVQLVQTRDYGGKVIPPQSVVRLGARCGNDQGRIFRVGHYNRQDGLNCVWQINESGEYEQTTDQKSIGKQFEVLCLSKETDLYGVNRSPLTTVTKEALLALGATG